MKLTEENICTEVHKLTKQIFALKQTTKGDFALTGDHLRAIEEVIKNLDFRRDQFCALLSN